MINRLIKETKIKPGSLAAQDLPTRVTV